MGYRRRRLQLLPRTLSLAPILSSLTVQPLRICVQHPVHGRSNPPPSLMPPRSLHLTACLASCQVRIRTSGPVVSARLLLLGHRRRAAPSDSCVKPLRHLTRTNLPMTSVRLVVRILPYRIVAVKLVFLSVCSWKSHSDRITLAPCYPSLAPRACYSVTLLHGSQYTASGTLVNSFVFHLKNLPVTSVQRFSETNYT